MTLRSWIQSTRRRWSGGLNPDEVDKVAVEFADRARREPDMLPGLVALMKVDGLFSVWLGALRRDLRAALTPLDRQQQLIALRQTAIGYLSRSNDGWRVTTDRRLSDLERDFISSLRKAPAFATALAELGEGLKRDVPQLDRFGLVAKGVLDDAQEAGVVERLTLRRNELALSGLLAQWSLIVLEALTKAYLHEVLLNENASLSTGVSDLQHLLRFKALAAANPGGLQADLVPIEQYLSKCLEGITATLEDNSLDAKGPLSHGDFSILRLDPREWGQVFMPRPTCTLAGRADAVATVIWAEIERLLVTEEATRRAPWSEATMAQVLSFDVCSVLFVARSMGLEVNTQDDFKPIFCALATMARSRGTYEFSGQSAEEQSQFSAEEQALLAIQMWLVDFAADPTASMQRFLAIATKLTGVTRLTYLEPIEQIAIFALVKYFILQDVIPGDGSARKQSSLAHDWVDAYSEHLRREKRLQRTLAVVMGNPALGAA